jgi:hypothetical protein
VPNRWIGVGGDRTAEKSLASGRNGAITGARIAIATTDTAMIMPITAGGRERSRRPTPGPRMEATSIAVDVIPHDL